MRVFKSRSSLQRGYGIGGLFRGLIRSATPLLKKGLLAAGKKALTAGANALGDVQENNETFRNAIEKQVRAALQNPINSSELKRKNTSSTNQPRRKVVKFEKLDLKKRDLKKR